MNLVFGGNSKMKVKNVMLIIIGAIIFVTSILGGGLLFHVPIPYYTYVGWFIGVILVAIGLRKDDQEKKIK